MSTKRAAILAITMVLIMVVVGLRLYQLTNQWERCAPSHDAIVEMWKRS
jgi:hypothetical protein